MSKRKVPGLYPELDKLSTPFAGLVMKQQAFVIHYLKHFNAARATRDAGYSEKGARQAGEQKLTKIDIKAAIADLMPHIGITPERISSALAEIAFGADPADYEALMTGKATLSEIREQGAATTLIKTIKRRQRTDSHISEDGKSIETVRVETEIRLHDRLAALDKLAKIQGMLESKVELVGGLSITVEMKLDESKAKTGRAKA